MSHGRGRPSLTRAPLPCSRGRREAHGCACPASRLPLAFEGSRPPRAASILEKRRGVFRGAHHNSAVTSDTPPAPRASARLLSPSSSSTVDLVCGPSSNPPEQSRGVGKERRSKEEATPKTVAPNRSSSMAAAQELAHRPWCAGPRRDWQPPGANVRSDRWCRAGTSLSWSCRWAGVPPCRRARADPWRRWAEVRWWQVVAARERPAGCLRPLRTRP